MRNLRGELASSVRTRCAGAHVVRLALVLFALALALSPTIGAHEIPNDVLIQSYVKPVRDRLQVLVRVPLAAMTEVDYPRRGAGYIDLVNADAALRQAAKLWLADNIEMYEGDIRLPYPRVVEVRVSLPSDRSFASYPEALSHVTDPPLAAGMDLVWNQQFLDALLEYPITSDRAKFSIRPRLERLGQRVITALVFLPPAGAPRAFELRGDPGVVHLEPSWFEAARRFVELGFLHILDGTDHLLFLLCVVIPFRRLAPLIVIVTSFTLAHSVTLIASALGHAPGGLWFPPLIEMLIAASILYMALENVLGSNVERRWMITFAFGLVHGFSFALRETLQFAGSHIVTSLLAFNVGVELGQLAVIVVLVTALNVMFRFVPERVASIILSAFIAHTALALDVGALGCAAPIPSADARCSVLCKRDAVAARPRASGRAALAHEPDAAENLVLGPRERRVAGTRTMIDTVRPRTFRATSLYETYRWRVEVRTRAESPVERSYLRRASLLAGNFRRRFRIITLRPVRNHCWRLGSQQGATAGTRAQHEYRLDRIGHHRLGARRPVLARPVQHVGRSGPRRPARSEAARSHCARHATQTFPPP
jgi:hypothetical protein